MKFNWKILVAVIVLVGAVFVGVNSRRIHAYSGPDLTFEVGRGPVMVTNSTDMSIPVQLLGTSTRTFSVSSSSEDISGRSERQGSGRTSTQLFEFDLPSGITELILVAPSTTVSFVADTDSNLAATVQPMSDSDIQTTMIATVIVILGSLFYISKVTGHRWINLIRRKREVIPDTHAVSSSDS